MIYRLKAVYGSLTLSQQFMLASLVILLGGMFGIGSWVESQIETGVVHQTGVTTALYIDSFVSPLLQELGQSEELQPENVSALRNLMLDTPMGQQIIALKVWSPKGRLLFASDNSPTGKLYPMHEGLLRARLGEVVSEISQLDDEENVSLGSQYKQLLEIYSPVLLSGTEKIIAVAEFYQRTDALDQEIAALRLRSWMVVGLSILAIYMLLAGFVRRASNTITHQQVELNKKVQQLSDLLNQNRELHEKVRRAAASVALLNESYLRRVGSELHDGPAQELGLSLLKVDALIDSLESRSQREFTNQDLDELSKIVVSLQSALKEMRSIATGLSLPQLAELDFPETIVRVVRAHERRTGTQVALEMDQLPEQVSAPLKITVYRLIQEALNNAFRHAGAAGQKVRVSSKEDLLFVEIEDSGPGIDPIQVEASSGRLGLAGMRERVESLGGTFRVESTVGQGTKIFASISCQVEGDGSA